MEIKLVASDKKEFLDLLLLADEQESMIDRYLERGDMFVLYDNGLKALCVVTIQEFAYFLEKIPHTLQQTKNKAVEQKRGPER